MNSFLNRTWVCPFYKYDERRSIHCECGSRLNFPSMTAERAYVDKYCASLDGWKGCTLARCLNDHYDSIEEIKHETNQR